MRLLLATFSFLCLALFSCQKEVDFAANGNRGTSDNSNVLLVKSVQQTGTDSLVTTYSYDANKKLINLKIVGIDQGTPKNTEYRYYRDGSGIITHISIIDADLVASGLDSVTEILHYNSASSRYTSYVLNINVSSFLLLDSVEFLYDASGKINAEVLYESPSGSGTDYYNSGSDNYTYTSGNINQLDIHDLNQSGVEIFTAHTSEITYDNKINPIQMGNEGIAIGHPEFASLNNITGEKLTDSNGIADNQTVTYVYTYNSNNRPATSAATVQPGNTTVTTSFFYQ